MKLPAGLKPPRAVLFDWDNTLVNTWPTIVECYHDTFTALGLPPWTAEEVRAARTARCATFSPACSAARAGEAERVFYETFYRIHLERLQPLAGRGCAAGALPRPRLLCRGGQQQGRRQPARRKLAHLGWQRWVSRAVGARDCRRDKPAPDPIFKALDGTGIAPDEAVWMVGDTPADLKCAHAAGCLPVLMGGCRGIGRGSAGSSAAAQGT